MTPVPTSVLRIRCACKIKSAVTSVTEHNSARSGRDPAVAWPKERSAINTARPSKRQACPHASMYHYLGPFSERHKQWRFLTVVDLLA